MRKQPQQARSIQMVDNIIEAAFICAAKRGLHQTSTHHIAEVAGVSVGNLYHYFKDKEAIFQEMHRRQIDEIIELVRAVMPELVQKDVKNGIELILNRFVDYLRADDGRRLAFFNQTDMLDAGEHLPRIEHELLSVATQYALRNPAVLTVRDFSTVVYVVINSGVLVILNYLSRPRRGISLEQVVDGVAKMASAYVAAESAPDGASPPAAVEIKPR
jgi:AcrR family transcriptional regulator